MTSLVIGTKQTYNTHTKKEKEKKKNSRRIQKPLLWYQSAKLGSLAKDLEYQSLGLHSRVSVRLRRAQKLSLLLA